MEEEGRRWKRREDDGRSGRWMKKDAPPSTVFEQEEQYHSWQTSTFPNGVHLSTLHSNHRPKLDAPRRPICLPVQLLWPGLFKALDNEDADNQFFDGSSKKLSLTKQTSVCTTKERVSITNIQGSKKGRREALACTREQRSNKEGKVYSGFTLVFPGFSTGAAASQCVTPRSVRQLGGLWGGGGGQPPPKGGGGPPLR